MTMHTELAKFIKNLEFIQKTLYDIGEYNPVICR